MSKLLVAYSKDDLINLAIHGDIVTIHSMQAKGPHRFCANDLKQAVRLGRGIVMSAGQDDVEFVLCFTDRTLTITKNNVLQSKHDFRDDFMRKLRLLIADDDDYDFWNVYFRDTHASIERSPIPLSLEELKQISVYNPDREIVVKLGAETYYVLNNGCVVSDTAINEHVYPKSDTRLLTSL